MWVNVAFSIFSPFLTFWRIWPIFAFIVFVTYLIPISREYSPTRCLITFDHCFLSCIISFFIYLLKQSIESSISFRFLLLLFSFNIIFNCIPIFFIFRWIRVSCATYICLQESSSFHLLKICPIAINNSLFEFKFNLLCS